MVKAIKSDPSAQPPPCPPRPQHHRSPPTQPPPRPLPPSPSQAPRQRPLSSAPSSTRCTASTSSSRTLRSGSRWTRRLTTTRRGCERRLFLNSFVSRRHNIFSSFVSPSPFTLVASRSRVVTESALVAADTPPHRVSFPPLPVPSSVPHPLLVAPLTRPQRPLRHVEHVPPPPPQQEARAPRVYREFRADAAGTRTARVRYNQVGAARATRRDRTRLLNDMPSDE